MIKQAQLATAQPSTDAIKKLPDDAPIVRFLLEKSRKPALGAYVAAVNSRPSDLVYGERAVCEAFIAAEKIKHAANGERLVGRLPSGLNA